MKYINLNHGIIRITGNDSEKFLQGLISNDIRKAQTRGAIYTYFLTPQGKYIADFFVVKAGENEFLIDCALTDKDLLIKKFSMYKLRSDVQIKDESEKYSVIQLIGDEGECQKFLLSGNPVIFLSFPDPRNKNLGYRIIAERTSGLQKFGSSEIKEYHKARIDNIVPEGEFDLEKEKSFPLQFRMIENNGVDFKKGCYVGQEVTARTNHRGVIRKTIYKVSAEEDLEKLSGQNIICDELEVGKLLTAVSNHALALIDVEAVESGVGIYVGATKLRVIPV